MNYLLLSPLPYKKYPFGDWLEDKLLNDNKIIVFYKKKNLNHIPQSIMNRDNITIEFIDDWTCDNLLKKSVKYCSEYEIARVISYSEKDVITAALIREKFNIKGQTIDEAKRFRDKYVMKSFMKKNKLEVPKFSIANSSSELLKEIQNFSFPIVIKPTDGSGSKGVEKIENIDKLKKNKLKFPILVEEYINSDVYFIDGYVLNGELKLLDISKYIGDCMKYKDGGNTSGYNISTSNAHYDVLKNKAIDIIRVMIGQESLPFHLEVFYNGSKFYICEIACRVGGGKTLENVYRKYKINLYQEFLNHEIGIDTKKIENSNKLTGQIMISPKKGKLVSIPEKPEIEGIFSYEVYGKKGMYYNGGLSSVHALLSMSIEGEDEDELIKKLNYINNYYENKIIYEK